MEILNWTQKPYSNRSQVLKYIIHFFKVCHQDHKLNSVCVCTCVYAYVCVFTCMHVCVREYKHVFCPCIFVCVCVYLCLDCPELPRLLEIFSKAWDIIKEFLASYREDHNSFYYVFVVERIPPKCFYVN